MAQKLNGEKKLCDRELLEKILSIVEKQEKLPPPAHEGGYRLYDNKSLMEMLNIKDKYLKKLRDNGYLLTSTMRHPNRPPKTSHRKVERLIYALV